MYDRTLRFFRLSATDFRHERKDLRNYESIHRLYEHVFLRKSRGRYDRQYSVKDSTSCHQNCFHWWWFPHGPSLPGPSLWVPKPQSIWESQHRIGSSSFTIYFLCAALISFMTGTRFMVFFYLEHTGGHVREEVLAGQTQRRSQGPGLALAL